MKTYFKTKNKDWYENITIFNNEPYPNQDKFTKKQMDFLLEKFPDGNTPKNLEVDVISDIKIILDNVVNNLLDFTKIDLIDITTHDDNGIISGVINYKLNGQQNQKRF